MEGDIRKDLLLQERKDKGRYLSPRGSEFAPLKSPWHFATLIDDHLELWEQQCDCDQHLWQ